MWCRPEATVRALIRLMRPFSGYFHTAGVAIVRRPVRGGTMRTSIGGALLVIWLLIGLVAAIQRDYFESSTANCASLGTVALTVIAGPLNYMGVNPKVTCDVNVPQPSK
jgi:hypothetical protein